MRWKSNFRKSYKGFRTKMKRRSKPKVKTFFSKKTFGISRWLLAVFGLVGFMFWPKIKEKLKS